MRMVLVLCCVLLTTAVNGGGLALAKSLDSQAVASDASKIVVETAIDLFESDEFDRRVEATPVRVASAVPTTPSGPCTSADCSWLMPSTTVPLSTQTAHPVSDSASILLAMAEALQLPPPRT